MKKRSMILPAAGAFLVLLLITILWIQKGRSGEEAFSEEYVLARELPAFLSFTYYDTKEWEEQLKGTVRGRLSYRELSELLKKLGVEEYVSYEREAGFRSVPRQVFFQVYEQILDLLDPDAGVSVRELVFLDVEEREGQLLTQEGYFPVEGGRFYIRPYDMYRVYMLDGKVLGVKEALDTPVLWENVFIHSAGEKAAQVLFEKELFSVSVPSLAEHITDTVCDIEFLDNAVSAIYKKEETIRGTVLSYDEKQIEIEGYGALPHDGALRIYKTYGTVEQLDSSKLIIGNLTADFVVAKGQVCGIILMEPAHMEQIRVLLLNGESPYYSELYVKADQELTASFGDTVTRIPAGTAVKASDYWTEGAEGYLRLSVAAEEGNLFLVGENQEPVSLGYQGAMEIRRFEEGYSVVNELPLETYLYAVVPSEMPASYEREALRAQAVCARSYACIQLGSAEYAKFAANVDDSTNYQVYNKQPRAEQSTLAVQDTVGEVLKNEGALAEAYYYSTSCGFSQNMDVWKLQPESFGYLKSVSLMVDGSTPDISTEEAFAAFIKSKDYKAYDSDAAYYRWQARLKPSESLEAMEAAAKERQKVNPSNVQCFGPGGGEAPLDFGILGAVTGFVPRERSAGGVLTKLEITCEQGSILVSTEYNIRKILMAAAVSVTDQNDRAITALNLLPSAAFTAVPGEDGFLLYGGGYGHGIGLSQNGANGMAKAGLTYVDILQKFYQNITIENIYNSPEAAQ